MKMLSKVSFCVVFISSLLFTGCGNNPNQANTQSKTQVKKDTLTQEQLIQRGDYLITIMGCHDCHSPKSMGQQGPEIIDSLALSGYPSGRKIQPVTFPLIKQGWSVFNPDLTSSTGPWGTSFSANLTSDQTGTGNWTEDNFKRALKEGKYKGLEGSRTLLPPMPWTNFRNLADEEIKAMFAYLKSTKPVNNIVPQPVIPKQ
jgi:mono/diheme cytochrome c family protein